MDPSGLSRTIGVGIGCIGKASFLLPMRVLQSFVVKTNRWATMGPIGTIVEASGSGHGAAGGSVGEILRISVASVKSYLNRLDRLLLYHNFRIFVSYFLRMSVQWHRCSRGFDMYISTHPVGCGIIEKSLRLTTMFMSWVEVLTETDAAAMFSRLNR